LSKTVFGLLRGFTVRASGRIKRTAGAGARDETKEGIFRIQYLTRGHGKTEVGSHKLTKRKGIRPDDQTTRWEKSGRNIHNAGVRRESL